MYKTVDEAVALVKELSAGLGDVSDREVLVCPPFTALYAAKAAIGDAIVDQGDVLHHDEASAKVEVTDFRVAHLAEWQADILLGSTEQRPRACRSPVIDIGRIGEFNTVAFGFGALAPAIEDSEHNRAWSLKICHVFLSLQHSIRA